MLFFVAVVVVCFCLFPVAVDVVVAVVVFWGGVLVCLFVVIVVVLGKVLFCFCFVQFDCLFNPCFKITNTRHFCFV